MQAVDITGLSERQVNELESNPMAHMSVGRDGIGMPVGNAMQPKLLLKGNPKNRSLLERFGASVFDRNGKLILSKLPKEELLKRLARAKGDARENLLAQLGEAAVIRFYNSGVINKSNKKLQTKKELNKACCRFTGITPKKSAEDRARAREQQKRKKEKERKDRKHGHSSSRTLSKTSAEKLVVGPATEMDSN